MPDDIARDIRLYLLIAQNLGVLVLGVYTWIVNRTKANKSAIDHLMGSHLGLKERFERLETHVNGLPGHGEIAAIHEKVNRVGASVERVSGELTGISRTLTLIHQSLLEDRKAGK